MESVEKEQRIIIYLNFKPDQSNSHFLFQLSLSDENKLLPFYQVNTSTKWTL